MQGLSPTMGAEVFHCAQRPPIARSRSSRDKARDDQIGVGLVPDLGTPWESRKAKLNHNQILRQLERTSAVAVRIFGILDQRGTRPKRQAGFLADPAGRLDLLE